MLCKNCKIGVVYPCTLQLKFTGLHVFSMGDTGSFIIKEEGKIIYNICFLFVDKSIIMRLLSGQ